MTGDKCHPGWRSSRPADPIGACSRDPIGYLGSTWNLYEFVDSQPTVKTDPLGLIPPDGIPGQTGPFGTEPYIPNGPIYDQVPPEVGVPLTIIAVGGTVIVLAPGILPAAGGAGGSVCCSLAMRQAATNAARQLPRLEGMAARRLDAIRRAQQSGNTQNLDRLIRQYDDLMERIWHAKGLIEKAANCF